MNNEIHQRNVNKIECHTCGYLHDYQITEISGKVRCIHCDEIIFNNSNHWLQKVIALTLSSIIFFIISNFSPFLIIELGGVSYQTNLLSGVSAMLTRDQYLLSLLIISTIFIFPLLEIISLSYLSISYLLKKKAVGQKFILGLITVLRPWSMLEIFLLSIVIALVKMNDFFTLIPGPALLSLFALVFCLLAANKLLHKKELWDFISSKNIFFYNKENRLMACKYWDALNDILIVRDSGHCCRCHKSIHERKPMSMQKTFALTLAACVLYIPANTFPMLHSTRIGDTQSDTIISGVLHLMQSGLWSLAIIVFIASVFVPVLKIITMLWLLYSVKIKSTTWLKQKTWLYRMIETIGRWSMVDVFVVILLVALVQFGFIANVEAGIAVLAFCGVVILTMLATEAFDPRLLWDIEYDRK